MISPTDRIALRGLRVDCIIGFIEWERHVKQTLLIDLELPVDCHRVARTDQVTDTLDYHKVADRVSHFVADSQFHLLETLAERLAMVVLTEFGVEWLRLSIKKRAAVPNLRKAEVVIERTAKDGGG